ncbi:MAG: very short patch repair endonuclease [Alphaproteobacteria bacterium]
MQSVKGRDTGPERIVRRILHRAGYRYRLHDRRLPGTPDIVFRSRRKAIFVHGCFWHAHGCAKGRPPKSRTDYWDAKIQANCARDARNRSDLEALGWEVLIVWQCELKREDDLATRLSSFLGRPKMTIDKADRVA